VKPGGRLIYATCSLLKEEDEDQVAQFLATHGDFALVPIPAIWAVTIGGDCPARSDTLRLSPARHGTDGFFVAVMERRALAKKAAATEDTP
jgi:16S rRNA (cytosine967-C5)-methyltransferase